MPCCSEHTEDVMRPVASSTELCDLDNAALRWRRFFNGLVVGEVVEDIRIPHQTWTVQIEAPRG